MCIRDSSWGRLHGIGDRRGIGLVQEGHTGKDVDEGERETGAQEGRHEGYEGTEQDRDMGRRRDMV
eukprot:3833251-Alexandrium_andersonii.AAC.1